MSDAPVTDVPVTDAPVTDVPMSDAPVTDVPVTDAPTVDVPVTEAPTADVPVTEVPGARDVRAPTTARTPKRAGAAKTASSAPGAPARRKTGAAERPGSPRRRAGAASARATSGSEASRAAVDKAKSGSQTSASQSTAQPRSAVTRPTPVTAKAPRRRPSLRQPPQPQGLPRGSGRREPPATSRREPSRDSSRRDLVATAVQAAAELTEIGLSAGARALREAVSRLPRP